MLASNSSGKSTGSGRKEAAVKDWVRIPDKTKVQYRLEDHRGAVDGLTEMVTGVKRNPDGRTQYRIDVGQPQRLLAAKASPSDSAAHSRRIASVVRRP